MGGRRFSLLIFDLDGTLIDSQRDLAAAVNHIRLKRGQPPLSHDTVRAYVGDGVRMLVRRALPALSDKELLEAVDEMKAYYRGHLLDTTVLYPGVRSMLERLGGIAKAVLTNKPEEFSRKILEGLGIEPAFKLVWGGDTGSRKKPDPDPVRKVLERFHCPAQGAILIGDGVNDIKAAKAAGIASLAVGYGYTPENELRVLQPDMFVSATDEIAEKVLAP